MFGKKKSEATNTRRRTAIVRETLERIVIRTSSLTQVAYCTSCGRVTRCLTPEQAQEIFGNVSGSIDGIHVSESGPALLLCADSIVNPDGDKEEKEK